MKTVLIDYGSSNLHSVYKALLASGFDTTQSHDPDEAAEADVLVLPGQGHFGQIMAQFLEAGLEPVVRAHISAGKPFLGICVGLQILMNSSEEAPGVSGLGIIEGTVKRFNDPDVSVPQMGWNQVYHYGDPDLLRGVPDGAFAYFANSYYVDFDADLPGAITRYGGTQFKSVVSQGHLHATQFHPEKSQAVGLKILGNFREVAERLYEAS